MANRDRRAQRKAKKRQERIRQNKHQAKFGFGFGGYGSDQHDEPMPMPRMAVNVHHVPGGDMVMMERTHRTMNFLLEGRDLKSMDEMQDILNTHLVGDAWKENHGRMLLSSDLERAQDLAFDAIEEEKPRKAIKLAKEALALDPACCDAHVIIATRDTKDANERLAILEGAIANERERLGGDAFFTENRGHFWGISTTRPYMRAHYAYALAFKVLGQYAEAAAACRILLELCTDDRQAVRYQYLACLMAGDLLEDLKMAIDDHREAQDAAWLWGRVLERLLADDTNGAKQALTKARRANFMVPVILFMPPAKRHACPPTYETGEASEAVYIADVYGCAWDAHPEALAWLKEHA
jgi:tetratricopeptide (TPR) repeat protein